MEYFSLADTFDQFEMDSQLDESIFNHSISNTFGTPCSIGTVTNSAHFKDKSDNQSHNAVIQIDDSNDAEAVVDISKREPIDYRANESVSLASDNAK